MSYQERQIRPDEDVVVNEYETEGVLLHLETECYFGLDEVGMAMWKALTTNDSVASALQDLLTQYSVDKETLAADLEHFVEVLLENQLVVVAKEGP